jgi:hypothetical protein
VTIAAVVSNCSVALLDRQITTDTAMRALLPLKYVRFVEQKFCIDLIKRAVTDGAAVRLVVVHRHGDTSRF